MSASSLLTKFVLSIFEPNTNLTICQSCQRTPGLSSSTPNIWLFCTCFASESHRLWFFCQRVYYACVKMTSRVGKHECSYTRRGQFKCYVTHFIWNFDFFMLIMLDCSPCFKTQCVLIRIPPPPLPIVLRNTSISRLMYIKFVHYFDQFSKLFNDRLRCSAYFLTFD